MDDITRQYLNIIKETVRPITEDDIYPHRLEYEGFAFDIDVHRFHESHPTAYTKAYRQYGWNKLPIGDSFVATVTPFHCWFFKIDEDGATSEPNSTFDGIIIDDGKGWKDCMTRAVAKAEKLFTYKKENKNSEHELREFINDLNKVLAPR